MKKGDEYKCSICGKIVICRGNKVGKEYPACYDPECRRIANIKTGKVRYRAKTAQKKTAKEAAKAKAVFLKRFAEDLTRLNDLICMHSKKHPELVGRQVSYRQDLTPAGFYLDDEYLGEDVEKSIDFIELNDDFVRWTTSSSKEISFDEVARLIPIAAERHWDVSGKDLAYRKTPGRPGYFLGDEYLGKTLQQAYSFIEFNYLSHLEIWEY